MAKSHAARTLEKKRADLKADLVQLDMLRTRTLERIAHVEATLALLREARRNGAPNGPLRRWLFRHGELRRLILAIEREADAPLTHREVARAIIARRQWDGEDRDLVALMIEKVKASRRCSRRCVVEPTHKPRTSARG